MKIIKLIILLQALITSAMAQVDTIRVSKSRTIILRVNNIRTVGADLSPKMTSRPVIPGKVSDKAIMYQVDTIINLFKFKAIRNFTEPIEMVLYSATESRRFVFIYSDTAARIDYASAFKEDHPKNEAVVTVENNGAVKKEKEVAPVIDNRSTLEKQASELISPKNKLFSALRSKNQNMSIGDLHGGVRIYLQKLYQSGNRTYFSIKISNYSMREFQLESFTITKHDGTAESPIQYINEESAYNLLKKYEKVDFIVITEDLHLNSTEKLVFSFKKQDQADKGQFRFAIDAKDLQKREAL